jgi:hypothetical protein
MPSTVAVLSGLTYKGTDLQDFPRVFLQITEGGPETSPETRGTNSTTPYRDGQRYGPRRADRLAITLTGWVAGEGDDEAEQRADTAAARRELFALFDVTAGEGDLVVNTEDGTEWTIAAYPEVFLPEWMPPVPTHQGISVRLVAIDPPEWEATGS